MCSASSPAGERRSGLPSGDPFSAGVAFAGQEIVRCESNPEPDGSVGPSPYSRVPTKPINRPQPGLPSTDLTIALPQSCVREIVAAWTSVHFFVGSAN
jgi:hypothetical protein